MNRIPALVTGRPLLCLLAVLLFVAPFVVQAPLVKTVDNVDYFVLEDDPDAAYYEEIKTIFGDDEFFVVAFQTSDIFTSEVLTKLQAITNDLEQLPGVRDVQSLANVDYIDGSQEYFEVRPFLQSIPAHPEALALLRRQALGQPLYVPNLLSGDGRTTAIVVFPEKHPEDGGFRKDLLQETQRILGGHQEFVQRFHLAGWTVTNLSLSQYMKSDIATFIPITYLLIMGILWLFFRNARLTLIGLANISVCMAATMGLFALSGITLNNVTTIVPPLIMALVLADTVHIFSHLDQKILEQTPDRFTALAKVLQRVIVPSFLTSLTTAVGFLSLAVSHIPPIKEFAYMASAGMIFKFFLTFFLLPPLLLFCDPEKIFHASEKKQGLNFLLGGIWRLVSMQGRWVIIAATALVAGCLWSATHIKVETNLLEYFKSSSPMRQDLDFVETNLGGVGTLDISLRAPTMDAFLEPRNLKIIDQVQQFIDTRPFVDATISFTDFLKDMNQAFHNGDTGQYILPDSRELVAQYLLLYDSEDIDDFMTSTYDHARIAVRISDHRSTGQAELISGIQDFINAMEPHGLTVRITGRAVHNVNTIKALVDGQVYSLAIAVGVISLIMFIGLRSLRIGLMSFIPNLFPIVLNFGIMGALGIPLNTATALISVVALGIAVDDTIHFLTEYTTNRRLGMGRKASLERATMEKGPALTITSIILCAGFGVMIFSQFVPTISFGALSAVIMLTALAGDILLLPALILGMNRDG
ncbi:MAG TPA: RND transporter [Desulfonatronum sp.]|nr:RND transporter [Desulfonatronum sp.]